MARWMLMLSLIAGVTVWSEQHMDTAQSTESNQLHMTDLMRQATQVPQMRSAFQTATHTEAKDHDGLHTGFAEHNDAKNRDGLNFGFESEYQASTNQSFGCIELNNGKPACRRLKRRRQSLNADYNPSEATMDGECLFACVHYVLSGERAPRGETRELFVFSASNTSCGTTPC